jgi:hypothetical protein
MSAALKQYAFKPGQSGNPGGKAKRAFPRPADILKQLGREPIAELMALLPQLNAKGQAEVWRDLLPYVHGKPQFTDEGADPLEEMSDEQLLKIVKQGAKEFAESK